MNIYNNLINLLLGLKHTDKKLHGWDAKAIGILFSPQMF